MGVFGLVTGQALEELARARLGNRADVADHLVARHAHAVIGHAQSTRRLVITDAYPQVRVVLPQRLVGQRLEAQLVTGVGRIGDEFAQEDLLVAVQRVHHQLQQLLDFGLKAKSLACPDFVHDRALPT